MVRYAISSGKYGLPEDETGGLLAQVHRLAETGVEFLQLREKHMQAGELAALAREIVRILAIHGGRTRLLINSRADVALAAGAHGVHLPSASGGLTPGQIRKLYRLRELPEPVVSKACHTRSEVLAARQETPNFILFSPVFGKGNLPGRGLAELKAVCALATPIPVLALGGITGANAASCVEAGAAGVAAIRLYQELRDLA
jgi:thiamine-phosphate pyrophosphorylase